MGTNVRILMAALALASIPFGVVGADDAPAPCASAEHRQFDFWIGSWEVRDPDGRVVGTNRISPILGGCVLLEDWRGAGGSAGRSFNVYDAGRGVWHQTWVDARGTLLTLEGGIRDGAMVLSGERPGADGRSSRERITWTPLDGDRVRQHWERSADGGANWTTVFDGEYVRSE